MRGFISQHSDGRTRRRRRRRAPLAEHLDAQLARVLVGADAGLARRRRFRPRPRRVPACFAAAAAAARCSPPCSQSICFASLRAVPSPHPENAILMIPF